MESESGSNKEYTCREVYEEGAALLSNLEDGRLDARLLLEHFCGITTNRLLADPESPVGVKDREAFLEGVRRRAARKPLAYIIGEQSFMGLPFVVSEDVLIPEQDTENLVEEAMRLIDDGSRILDLCTGSGCILLSLLRYTNGCVGVGTDISEAALAIAGKNAENLGLSGQTAWAQGDLFSALEQFSGGNEAEENATEESDPGENTEEKFIDEEFPSKECSDPFAGRFSFERTGAAPGTSLLRAPSLNGTEFDLIISNPPYIPTGVIGTLAPEVRCQEPWIALDGGTDGLDFYRRIISEAPEYLVIGGRLMLEIGYDQAQAVTSLLEEAGYYGIEILKDYGGNDRIATAVCSLTQKNKRASVLEG